MEMAIKIKKKIKWFPENKHTGLSEAVSGGPQFSLVSDENEQVSQFCFCKDYLHDAIYGHLNKKSVSIYGFFFDPKNNPAPSIKEAKILTGNSSDPKFREKVPNCIDFLNQFEKALGMKKLTCFFEVSKPPVKYSAGGVWLVCGDKRWVNSPPMLSLYSLLIRIGFGHKIGTPFMDTIKGIESRKITPYQSCDYNRISGSTKIIEKILKKGDEDIFGTEIEKNYPNEISVSTMHNYCGIMGLQSETCKGSGGPNHWFKN